MYIFVMGILALLFIANFGNTVSMLSISILIAIASLVKLAFLFKDLQFKFTMLENRFETYVKEQEAEKEEQTVATAVIEDIVEEPTVEVVAQKEVEVVEPIKSEADTQVSAYEIERPSLKAHDNTQLFADPIDGILKKIKTYFTTGNPMVKIGGVILFFGLTFLIRFAFSNDMISIEAGLFSVLLFGIVLTGVGWKFKARQGDFGLILQGVGIAIFYLAIFAGAKFFAVIPFGVALAAMVLTVLFATMLAVLQNAFYLAIFATVGGFLAPILTSTGEGSHVVLFSYYAFLNLSIIAIAWFKAWRVLNLVGFVFTFVISTAWGVQSYSRSDFATTEPFLILFSLMYIAVAILFAHRKPFALKAYVDATLVFGVPTVGFGLQAALVQDFEYGLAFSALATSALYLSLAWWLRKKEKFSLLSESFLALGVVFLSLVFAFAFAPEVSSVIFALEASAIIWISFRQDRTYSRVFALVLLVYALGSLFKEMRWVESAFFLNSSYLGFAILALAMLCSSYIYFYYRAKTKPFEAQFSKLLLGVGLLLWLGAGFHEVKHSEYAYFLIYAASSTLGLMLIAPRLEWDELTKALELYMPLGLLSIVMALSQEVHPFVKHYSIALVLYFSVYYFMLYRLKLMRRKDWHVAGLWLMLLLLSWELFYHLEKSSTVIALSGFALLPVLAIYLIMSGVKFWPLTQEKVLYQKIAVFGIGIGLMLWQLFAFVSSAELMELVYIPLLNPLELMQVGVVVTLLWWMRRIGVEKRLQMGFAAFFVMAFATLFLARSVHYYGDVFYSLHSLGASSLFQMSLSIMYTLMALAVIIYAKKSASRFVWMSGAGLLGFVIVKLLLVDMANSGSLERIISFLVVGVLILLVGFIAPLPPKQEEKTA